MVRATILGARWSGFTSAARQRGCRSASAVAAAGLSRAGQWSKLAAGICAATSASACSSTSDSIITQTNIGTGGVWPASWRIDAEGHQGHLLHRRRHRLCLEQLAAIRCHRRIPRRREAFKAVGSYTEFCAERPLLRCLRRRPLAFVGLANAYVDLGTWWCLTPFIGAGVGGAYHKFTDALTDVGYGLAPGTSPSRSSAMPTPITPTGAWPGRCMPAWPTP